MQQNHHKAFVNRYFLSRTAIVLVPGALDTYETLRCRVDLSVCMPYQGIFREHSPVEQRRGDCGVLFMAVGLTIGHQRLSIQ
jgi:hypothetical protein